VAWYILETILSSDIFSWRRVKRFSSL
jgi:hypothetical protein